MCLTIKRENNKKWDDNDVEKNEIVKNYKWKVEKFWLGVKKIRLIKISENLITEKVLKC